MTPPMTHHSEPAREAAEYVHPEDAAEMFVECIADEVMAALAPLGEAGR